jgi:dolichyl-phosphate-mannose-protein mannosyltransferase
MGISWAGHASRRASRRLNRENHPAQWTDRRTARRHLLILLTLVAIALAARLPFIDRPGLPSDIALFVAWAETAATQGLADLFGREDYNYPPVASYIFFLVGHLQRDVLDRPFSTDSLSMRAALKLPALLSDLVITAVLYLFLARRTSLVIAIAGALAYALNPAIIHDSMVWGQWDSLVALPMLLATICLIASRPRLATAFLMIAILIKFQAVVLVPLFFVVILRQFGWRGLQSSALTGAATATILLIPVIVAGQIRQTVDVYVGLTHAEPWISLNAYNLWWLVNWLQSGSPTITLKGGESLFGPITYKQAALGLYAIAVGGGVAAFARMRLSVETISLGASASVIAFFTLAPEMHERYLLPALPLLILAFDSRLHRWIVAILSLTLFLNLHWTLSSAEGVPWSTPKLAATGVLSAVNLAALAWIGVELFRRSVTCSGSQRRAWQVGATFLLAVTTLASFAILRWYVRDVRG